MIRLNAHTQKKIEGIFDEAGYTVRYEKGSFNSGYCLLESRKVVVINKFHPVDAKINSLVEILGIVNIDVNSLDPESQKFLRELTAQKPNTLFEHAA
jgi:hypothetical protein